MFKISTHNGVWSIPAHITDGTHSTVFRHKCHFNKFDTSFFKKEFRVHYPSNMGQHVIVCSPWNSTLLGTLFKVLRIKSGTSEFFHTAKCYISLFHCKPLARTIISPFVNRLNFISLDISCKLTWAFNFNWRLHHTYWPPDGMVIRCWSWRSSSPVLSGLMVADWSIPATYYTCLFLY